MAALGLRYALVRAIAAVALTRAARRGGAILVGNYLRTHAAAKRFCQVGIAGLGASKAADLKVAGCIGRVPSRRGTRAIASRRAVAARAIVTLAGVAAGRGCGAIVCGRSASG